MTLGNLPVPGRPTIWLIVGQGPNALAVGAGGVVLTFLLSSIPSLLCLPLFGRVGWCWVNRGVLQIWIRVEQWPTAFAVGADGGCLDIFTLVYHFSFLSP